MEDRADGTQIEGGKREILGDTGCDKAVFGWCFVALGVMQVYAGKCGKIVDIVMDLLAYLEGAAGALDYDIIRA